MSVTVSTSSTSITAPAVNMSNGNAFRVLELLGVAGDDRYAGSLDAEDFLGRVMIAEALTPEDDGVVATQEGNFYDCGRREGYIQDRLAQLREVAEAAVAHGGPVRWS